MRHEPSGFQGHAQGPVQLVRANALLAGAHQVDSLKPKVQLDMACLEDGPDLDGKGLAAGVALVSANAGALALHGAGAIYNTAVRAYTAMRPNARLYELVGRVFVMEMRGGKYGHDVDSLC